MSKNATSLTFGPFAGTGIYKASNERVHTPVKRGTDVEVVKPRHCRINGAPIYILLARGGEVCDHLVVDAKRLNSHACLCLMRIRVAPPRSTSRGRLLGQYSFSTRSPARVQNTGSDFCTSYSSLSHRGSHRACENDRAERPSVTGQAVGTNAIAASDPDDPDRRRSDGASLMMTKTSGNDSCRVAWGAQEVSHRLSGGT
jgi:hypothetical protein